MSCECIGFGIRLNKTPPPIYFKKKEKGGINMTSTVALTHLDLDAVKAILGEYKIHNAGLYSTLHLSSLNTCPHFQKKT
jgi:ribosome-interacting GTPase 1